MRQTLFHINMELFGLPMFGFGWLLIVWCLFAIGLFAWLLHRQGWNTDTRSWLPILAIIGAVIYGAQFILPESTGLPIRGYGMMLMLAILAASTAARWRAQQLGLDPELIVSLALWLVVSGIVGARIFYVIQYRDQYWHQPWAILQFYEGGLVVYGALIGASVGSIAFLKRRNLPILAVADMVAPSLMLGLAIGRIGCLLNGCCWGGQCGTDQWGIQFPVGSPAYTDQLTRGTLLGLKTQLSESENGTHFVVTRVQPQMPADGKIRLGQKLVPLAAGNSVHPIRVHLPGPPDASADLLAASAITEDTGTVRWQASEISLKSLPVVPSQIYSSCNAFFLFLVVWFAFPFRNRDGQIFALLFTLYPITRFMLEIIRADEGAQFGTTLTISQIVSIVILCGSGCVWWYIMRLPPQTAFPTFGKDRAFEAKVNPSLMDGSQA